MRRGRGRPAAAAAARRRRSRISRVDAGVARSAGRGAAALDVYDFRRPYGAAPPARRSARQPCAQPLDPVRRPTIFRPSPMSAAAQSPAPRAPPPRACSRRRYDARARRATPRRAAQPLGPSRAPPVAGATGTVSFSPAATLACPMVSALDQWIATAVQPAAMRWFGQPVVEIRQISAYSCRGMNGNPRRAHLRACLRQRARHRLLHARRRPPGHGARRLARRAGGAGLPARRAGRGLRALHHRAGAGLERLPLRSHPCGPDAAARRAPAIRARFRARRSPRGRVRTTPSRAAIRASPARSASARASPCRRRPSPRTRSATSCRSQFPARTARIRTACHAAAI